MQWRGGGLSVWRCLTASSPGVISSVSPLVEPTAVGPRRSRRQAPGGGGGTPRKRGEVETIVVVVGFPAELGTLLRWGWGVLGLEGERISCFVLIYSVPFTALTPCVSAPSIGKEQPRSRCSASADAPFSTSSWSFGRGRQQRIETAARHRGSELDAGAEEGSRQEGSQQPQVPRSPRWWGRGGTEKHPTCRRDWRRRSSEVGKTLIVLRARAARWWREEPPGHPCSISRPQPCQEPQRRQCEKAEVRSTARLIHQPPTSSLFI